MTRDRSISWLYVLIKVLTLADLSNINYKKKYNNNKYMIKENNNNKGLKPNPC